MASYFADVVNKLREYDRTSLPAELVTLLDEAQEAIEVLEHDLQITERELDNTRDEVYYLEGQLREMEGC